MFDSRRAAREVAALSLALLLLPPVVSGDEGRYEGFIAPSGSAEHHTGMNDRGYRAEELSAPLPERHPDAITVTVEALRVLIEGYDPVLIDVMPRSHGEDSRYPHGLEPDATRTHIPGSDWLPNVGYPQLEAYLTRAFRRHLEARTEDDLDRPVVFYCEQECWMGWNAARRAHRWGYRYVYWFPGGVEAWSEAGLTTEEADPWPQPPPRHGPRFISH